MESLKAILVDDELNSLQNLEQKIIEFCPDLTIVGKSQEPEEAIAMIRQLQPDLVFLDIEMPRISGFRVVEALADLPLQIIFTTAYNHYAIDAIRSSAFDYLVKPISVEELQNAVNRLLLKHSNHHLEKLNILKKGLQENKSQEDSIAIPTSEGMELVQIKQIVRVESLSNYSKLYLVTGQTFVVTRLLKEFEEMLSGYRFYRVHHSHVINLFYVKKYIRGEGGQVVLQNGETIDVARRKRDEFLKLITG